MNLGVIKILLAVFAVAAAIAGWNAFLNHQQDIGYRKAEGEYAQKLADAKQASLDRERFLRTQVTDAQNARIAIEKKSAASLAAAASVSRGLRDDINHYRTSLPGYSIEAASAAADTGLRLLGDCQERYLSMAAAAKGHQADSMMFQEAWPK